MSSPIAAQGTFDQIGGPASSILWPVLAVTDGGGNITGMIANGVAISLAAALEAQAASTGLFNLTGGSAVPTAATFDQIVNALSALRAGSADPVGVDGNAVVRLDLGGLLRQKSAGSWADVVAPTATFAQLYDGTYPAADHTNRARLVTTCGVWTLNEWFWSDGTQWWPVNRVIRLLDATPSSAISPVAETLVKADVFPANLLRGAGMVYNRAEFVYVGTNGTKDPTIRFGASGAGVGGTNVYNNAAVTNTFLHSVIHTVMHFNSNTSQHMVGAAVNTSTATTTGAGARTTAAIDVTAACELAYGCTLASASDTVATGHTYTEIHFPSRKT
jgi:hypothetical protein